MIGRGHSLTRNVMARYSVEGVQPIYVMDIPGRAFGVGAPAVPVELSDVVTATAGSIRFDGLALFCPGDGSRVYNTVGLTTPEAGTVIVYGTADDLSGDQVLIGGGAWDGESLPVGLITDTVPFRAAMAWDDATASVVAAVDGVSASDSYAGAFGGTTPLGIGSQPNGDRPFTGSIGRVVILPAALTEAQLQDLTGE